MCEILLSKILCLDNQSDNWWFISWGRRVLCKGKGLTPSPGRSAWTVSGPSWAGAGDRSLERHPSPRNYMAWTSSPSSFHWEKQVTNIKSQRLVKHIIQPNWKHKSCNLQIHKELEMCGFLVVYNLAQVKSCRKVLCFRTVSLQHDVV